MKALSSLMPAAVDASYRRPGTALALSRADASAILARPPSPRLRDCLDVASRPLERVETPDIRWPDGPPWVSYRVPSLPICSKGVLLEAQERLAAMDAMLAPASMSLRRTWALYFANAVERRFAAEDVDAEVDTLAGFLDLPPACFLEDVSPDPDETAAELQHRRVIARVRFAARACGGWWASYGKLEPILAPFADDGRARLRQFREVVARLQEQGEAQAAIAAVKPLPADLGYLEALGYLDKLEAQPADAGRRVLARIFRTGLSAADREHLAPRLDPLCDVQDTSAPAPARLSVPPLNPDGTVARQLAAMAAERHAEIRKVTLTTDDDQLARLQAEAARLVSLD